MEKTFDIVVIGAGIVGLAVGLEILTRQPDIRLLILEKEHTVACHQTGHNSGVIHSGIYYKPGSLKARLCTAGAAAMLEFVKAYGIPFEQCGKVIVATEPKEIPALNELYRRGQANGVPGLHWLPDFAAIREVEPHSTGLSGIHVPSTAITDFKMVAEQYAKLISERGGALRFGAGVSAILRQQQALVLFTAAGEFHAKYVINCAGLHSDHVAQMVGARLDAAIFPFRGEYYEVKPTKHHLLRGLLYPVPDPNFPFLGVHFTRRIRGGIEAGPNAVLALKREGYKRTSLSIGDSFALFSSRAFWRMASRYWPAGLHELYRSFNKRAFTRSLQKLLPEIQESDLCSGGAGVRAQAVDRDGSLVDDFRFVHGERVTHVCNVPSPAATASLQIAKVVANVVLLNRGAYN